MTNKILLKQLIKINLIKYINQINCNDLKKKQFVSFNFYYYKICNINKNLLFENKTNKKYFYFYKKLNNNNNNKFKYLVKIENIKKNNKIFNLIRTIKKAQLCSKTKNSTSKIYHKIKSYENGNCYNYNNFTNTLKFQKVFNNIFYTLFKKKVNIINFNYFLKVKIKKFNYIVRKVLGKNFFLKKTIVTYKIIKMFLASLIYKDSSLMILIIKKMFENVHYSKHKIYFNFWSFLIKSFVSNNFKKLNIFGLKIEFHGKLGVGGNSKKRSYYYHIGRCSNSSKFFKIDSSHSYFNTDTGVVGFTFSIFY